QASAQRAIERLVLRIRSKFSQPGKPAPRLASSHAKYPDIYRRSKPAVAKLRREAAAFGVNGIMEYKADISEARLGSAARRAVTKDEEVVGSEDENVGGGNEDEEVGGSEDKDVGDEEDGGGSGDEEVVCGSGDEHVSGGIDDEEVVGVVVVMNRRKKLSPFSTKYRSEGQRANLVYDHLIVHGERYDFDPDSDSIYSARRPRRDTQDSGPYKSCNRAPIGRGERQNRTPNPTPANR
ncbi:hypothetical protein ElyMa_005258500, partial [Elysia marginata]